MKYGNGGPTDSPTSSPEVWASRWATPTAFWALRSGGWRWVHRRLNPDPTPATTKKLGGGVGIQSQSDLITNEPPKCGGGDPKSDIQNLFKDEKPKTIQRPKPKQNPKTNTKTLTRILLVTEWVRRIRLRLSAKADSSPTHSNLQPREFK